MAVHWVIGMAVILVTSDFESFDSLDGEGVELTGPMVRLLIDLQFFGCCLNLNLEEVVADPAKCS